MVKVVIDTNVLISAFLKPESIPALIVSLVFNKNLMLCLSEGILIEYKEVLNYGKFRNLNQTEVRKLINLMKENALWVSPKELIDLIKDDPEDNKFLECALEAQADFFITGNTKHFSFEQFHQTRIVKPKQFMDIFSRMLFE